MKSILIIGATTLASVWLFFFATYARRKILPEKPKTLFEMYADFVRELPTLNPRMRMMVPVLLAGLLASFYPVLLLTALRLGGRDAVSATRLFVFFPGIVSLVGVAVNVLVMILSQLTFGFGMSTPKRNTTVFFWIIPIFQAGFAIVGIAAGASATAAELVYRIIG